MSIKPNVNSSIFPKFTILILGAFIIHNAWAGGAKGKEFGSLYTQLSYSPIETSSYTNSEGEQIEGQYYSRMQYENYGEIGIWNSTTTLVWNLAWIQQELGGKTSQGLSNSHFAVHHQWIDNNFKFGQGLFVDITSPEKAQPALSQELNIFGYSQFHVWQSWEANLHLLTNGTDHGLRFDIRKTWTPLSQLYLSGALRGQFTTADLSQSPNFLGYGLQTQYISPGVEAFYSLNSKFHLLGAIYGGALMRQIYAFPGLKVGVALTL